MTYRKQYLYAGGATLALLAIMGAIVIGAALAYRTPTGAHSTGHACGVNHPAACRAAIYPPHGRCFPVRKWNADATKLPCVEVRRVYEDGSFKVAVLDGDGTVRYTAGYGALDR